MSTREAVQTILQSLPPDVSLHEDAREIEFIAGVREGRTWPEPAVTLAKPLSGDAILRAVEEALRRARAKNVSAHA